MSSAQEFRIGPLQQMPSKGREMPPASGIRWRGWAIVLGALCVLGAPGHAYSAGPAAAASNPSCQQYANFSFDEFTKNKPFRLNTLCTTPYPPPPDATPDTPAWADILRAPTNFLACKGASIALCYYSGPENTVTPCTLDGEGIANCTCYAIPHGSTYYVDINAILNLDVYLDTVSACGVDGRDCQPHGTRSAPVCDAINGNKLIPGADLISTFSTFLAEQIPITINDTCPSATYAGCMTAPCKRTADSAVDPVTGLELVECACPTYTGFYQVGNLQGNSCGLASDNVWSAAYTELPDLTPQPPPPHDCWPDAPQGSGSACPLLPLERQDWPGVPPTVSCKDVCKEYKQSNQNGVQIGFTCDATLCTAKPREFDIVAEACGGLGKSSLGEILKLEIEVGYSCSASQICGCEPNKKTNVAIYNFNQAQREAHIPPQCDQNGTLCGTQP